MRTVRWQNLHTKYFMVNCWFERSPSFRRDRLGFSQQIASWTRGTHKQLSASQPRIMLRSSLCRVHRFVVYHFPLVFGSGGTCRRTQGLKLMPQFEGSMCLIWTSPGFYLVPSDSHCSWAIIHIIWLDLNEYRERLYQEEVAMDMLMGSIIIYSMHRTLKHLIGLRVTLHQKRT